MKPLCPICHKQLGCEQRQQAVALRRLPDVFWQPHCNEGLTACLRAGASLAVAFSAFPYRRVILVSRVRPDVAPVF